MGVCPASANLRDLFLNEHMLIIRPAAKVGFKDEGKK
ncbi:MAG: hypothetical protein ACD_16C00075G0008, partial [uncultured bacterium]